MFFFFTEKVPEFGTWGVCVFLAALGSFVIWGTFDRFKQILPETNCISNGVFYTLQLIFIEGISVHRTDALTLSSLSDPINEIKRNCSCEAYLTRPLLGNHSHIRPSALFWIGLCFLTAFIQLKLDSQTSNCLIYYGIIVSENCIVKLSNGFCSSLPCCHFFFTHQSSQRHS